MDERNEGSRSSTPSEKIEKISKSLSDDRPKRIRKPKTPISSFGEHSGDERKISPGHADEVIIAENESTPYHEPSEELLVDANQKTMKNSGVNKSSYMSMVHEAIVSLKERTGSSIPAIKNTILSKNEHFAKIPSQQFNRFILAAIKTGLRTSRFIKVKCSYKINVAWTKKEKVDAQKRKQRDKKRKKTPVKKNAVLDDPIIESDHAQQDNLLTEEELAERIEQDMAEIETARLKEEATRRSREIAERIKKRKFPMDDSELEKEDKELGVKPPSHVSRRPFLPYALTYVVPFEERPRGKKNTPSVTINACTTKVHSGTMGLISDVLSVYNFFSGDVGYSRIDSSVAPEFSLSHILHAIHEIVIGNCKANKSVPPLLSHIALTCLNVLTTLSESDLIQMMGAEESNMVKVVKRLHLDLAQLNLALSETSWGEVLFYYLDLMERFHTSENSANTHSLSGFALNSTTVNDQGTNEIPPNESYRGYLGDISGALYRGFSKLARMDPWLLSADELMAIIRSLTDDILSFHPILAEDISKREEVLAELSRNKKAAETHFRKVRLAFEGPKQPSKAKQKKDSDDNLDEKKGGSKKTATNHGDNDQKLIFVPTATKNEYEESEKAKNKAVEAYERGLKKYVSRSEPLGMDKQSTQVYWFRNDPDSFFLEVNRSNAINDVNNSWHIIDTKGLFDDFVSSLDVRGVRQYNLHEEMVGSSGSSSLRRFLRDSNYRELIVAARQREMEELERRLENAKHKCDLEDFGGRRSGRLAPNAKSELEKIMKEMDQAAKKYEERMNQRDPDYQTLTGINFLNKYEKEAKESFRCARQWLDRSSGVVDTIASDILNLECLCNDLSPWERSDTSRADWRKKLSDVIKSWSEALTFHLGPRKVSDAPEAILVDNVEFNDSLSHRNVSTSVSISFANLLQIFKDYLIDIEKRIFTVTGMEKAEREAEEADEIEYTMSNAEDNIKCHDGWKKRIIELQTIPSKRASAIRDTIISAITISRKRHLMDVVEDLRSALQLHRPGAAGQCKAAALQVLKNYGYSDTLEVKEGTTTTENENAADVDDIDSGSVTEQNEQIVESFLCGEAMMMGGCLEGLENANRHDWKDTVKTAKTISRIGALVEFLSKRCKHILTDMRKCQSNFFEALESLECPQKSRKGRPGKGKQSKDVFSDIWVNTVVTNDLVLAKIRSYPHWPARICTARDSAVGNSLRNAGLRIVSFVGEPHLHVISEEDMKPFSVEAVEAVDLTGCDPDTVKKFLQCATIAKLLDKRYGRKEKLQAARTS